MGPPWKRAKTPFIAMWVLFWDVVLIIVVGHFWRNMPLFILSRISLAHLFVFTVA